MNKRLVILTEKKKKITKRKKQQQEQKSSTMSHMVKVFKPSANSWLQIVIYSYNAKSTVILQYFYEGDFSLSHFVLQMNGPQE